MRLTPSPAGSNCTDFFYIWPSFAAFPFSSDELILYSRGRGGYHLRWPDINLVAFVDLLFRGVTSLELPDAVCEFDPHGDLSSYSTAIDEMLKTGIAAQRNYRAFLESQAMLASDVTRFSRHISYFSEFETSDVFRFDFLRRIRDARVLLVGVGSLGSWVLQHLVASGIGHMCVVDLDFVEDVNLPMQSLFRHRDIGVAKVLAAARAGTTQSPLTSLSSVHTSITSAEDIECLLRADEYDLFVLTADTPPHEIAKWASQAALETGTPLIRANSLGVGPFFFPGETSCPVCYWPKLLEEFPNACETLRLRGGIRSRTAGATSVEIGIVGALLADEIIAFISGARPIRTRSAQIVVTMEPLSISVVPFSRSPECPVCGVSARI